MNWAKAVDLTQAGTDARVVTEEKKDMPRKVSLRTAAGQLGIPSVPLRAFLEFEGNPESRRFLCGVSQRCLRLQPFVWCASRYRAPARAETR